MSTHFISYKKLVTKKVSVHATVDLTGCPFCGGEADFKNGGNWHPKLNRRMGFSVQCKDCGAKTPFKQGFDAQMVVAEMWNKRSAA